MAYRIDTEEPVAAAVRRIAREQVDRAISQLRDADAGADVERSIHECRKRTKELRGLVRLVRPALGHAYRPANTAFRDAARQLSPFRDDHALFATFDDVIAADPLGVPAGGVGPVWRELARRADDSTASLSRDSPAVRAALELLVDGAEAIDAWELDRPGWDAVAGGVSATYRRGVTALAEADGEPTADRFHELRKRAKYTWYHLLLLENSAPPVLRPMAACFHGLSDALGDAHDLAVLRDVLLDDPEAFGGDGMVESALVLVDGCRALLERRGSALGALLYAEDPEAFVGRLGAYWALRSRHPGGDTGDLAQTLPPGDGWDDLTVEDLRRLARRIDLPGRSRMRRGRLVAALRAEGERPNSAFGVFAPRSAG